MSSMSTWSEEGDAMFVTVTGGSGSGKSAFAEEQILKFPEKNRLYIATMVCFDEESRQRVKRHRKMSSFITDSAVSRKDAERLPW